MRGGSGKGRHPPHERRWRQVKKKKPRVQATSKDVPQVLPAFPPYAVTVIYSLTMHIVYGLLLHFIFRWWGGGLGVGALISTYTFRGTQSATPYPAPGGGTSSPPRS